MGMNKKIHDIEDASAQGVRVGAGAVSGAAKVTGNAVGVAGQKGGSVVGTVVHETTRAIGNTSDKIAEEAGKAGNNASHAVSGFIGKPKK